jgi:hypothetical protein
MSQWGNTLKLRQTNPADRDIDNIAMQKTTNGSRVTPHHHHHHHPKNEDVL